MELNMEEIHNQSNKNQMNYWEHQQAHQTEKPKKKRVTFDDILTNMNLVVSQNGVLQYMKPISQPTEEYQNQYYQQQPNNYQQQQPNYNNQPNYQQNRSEPLDPQVKHSYIFNKYFKDYKDANNNHQPIGPRRPQSIEELKQMLREDKIKEIQRKIRLAQIKPKHMLFNNAGGIRPSINTLGSMGFR